MPLPRLRAAWWIVMVGLSAMLSLNFVLPLLNVSAGEYTPFHLHVLVGGTAAQRAWLLTHHQHGYVPAAPAITAPAATTPSDKAPSIINTGNSLGDLLSLSAAGPLLVAAAELAVKAPLPVWALLLAAALLLPGLTPPPPDRPPRLA
jgi:hypothetical protein